MRTHHVIHKAVGQTPLMALQAWKERNPEYKNVLASYAGRLDPMASGKLLVLLGDECKRQKEYTKLDKEYDIEVLLDVGSDTGDALGLVTYTKKKTTVDNFSRVGEILRAEEGSHVRPYPHFSSKTVGGKPLFLHALEGSLSAITIPTHVECIYRIKLRDATSLSYTLLAERIAEFLTRVPRSREPSKELGADFRIEQVKEHWERVMEITNERRFTVLTLRVTCGSGTYMRSLAPRIGAALGTEAIALSIVRTKIGRYWRGVHYLHALR